MRKFIIPNVVKLCGLACVVCVALLPARPAMANAILGLQNTNGSPYVDLTSILNGSYQIANIVNGSPSAGSINVRNNVAGGITTLTLDYHGVTGPANDAGSTLDCHNFNFGGGNTTCSVYDPNNGMYYDNGTSTPSDLPLNNYIFEWTFASSMTGNFNIDWASFSGSGYTGTITGSPVPEPSSLLLLATGLLAAALVCRKTFHQI